MSNKVNPEFNKVLSRLDVLVLAFGAMIGWGWVVLSGEWINRAGSLGAMIAFLIGGVLVIFVGLTFAELTTALPKAGGEIHFALTAMGTKSSFIVGWAMLLGYISVSAFEAVALPTVVEYLFPGYMKGYLWTIADWDVYLSWLVIGVVGAIIVTWINIVGVKQAAFFQVVLTILLAAVGLLLIFGAGVNGEPQNMEPLFTGGMAGLMGVMIMTPFMFVGFDVIPQIAEEVNMPKKSMGRLLILSVSMAVAWYVLIILGVSLALDSKALSESILPTADAMASVFGSPLFGKILILGGIAGIITSWNAFIMGAGRIIYAMAREGMLPKWFAKIHPKYKTPTNAIIFVGFLSTIAPFFGRPALVWLSDAGSLSIVIAYFIVALSFVILRKKRPDLERPFKAGESNAIGIIAVLLSIFFIVLYMPGMPASLIWPYEWIIIIAWFIIGFLFFALIPKSAHEEMIARNRNEMFKDL